MTFKGEIVERVSKNGKPYKALELTLYGNVKKLVFLNDAEIELLKMNNISKWGCFLRTLTS